MLLPQVEEAQHLTLHYTDSTQKNSNNIVYHIIKDNQSLNYLTKPTDLIKTQLTFCKSVFTKEKHQMHSGPV